MPPSHFPRCSVTDIFSEVFRQSDLIIMYIIAISPRLSMVFCDISRNIRREIHKTFMDFSSWVGYNNRNSQGSRPHRAECLRQRLPLRGAVSRRLTERCYRTENFPQGIGLCIRALPRRRPLGGTPLRHGFAVPPPLKGRLRGAPHERESSPQGEALARLHPIHFSIPALAPSGGIGIEKSAQRL